MDRGKIRALALFSGGLDSALAIKTVLEQGVDVIALNFVSHFFGGKNEKAENMAKQLGIRLEYIDFKKRHTGVVQDPVYGYGKNMNPCIDCHSLMFKIAGELLEEYDAQFVISGEVLGQRPMSQNSQALEKVKLLSGMHDLVLRPLSAKLLPPSKAEIEGWVDREKLLDIQGRSRHRQMELMEKYGIVDYPSPGGGCLLTDPAYSDRLRIVEEDGLLEEKNAYIFYLLREARFFRFAKGRYLFVGRNHESNMKISEFTAEGNGEFFAYSAEVPGPRLLSNVNLTGEEKEFAKKLFSTYSKVKGNERVNINICGIIEEIDIVDKEKFEKEKKLYQII
ncbi:tRNA (5-methylaminomethyl-2-thiouridylate)-methyltransferase [Fusobacterium gastrosuis]|uniref:tRNA (5-methylaminomethyl-2-thiouridylate)-methyltransferase n=1 Tax=Fusobacterium gastrosuis TaxID=1755100 RepID=UPI002A9C3DD3|nr:tRNA (5-methylaminomethyl-2-thiouridylate)-methyltransferase [Fusobacterium gastrosuis]